MVSQVFHQIINTGQSETGITREGRGALARWRCAKYGNVSPGEFIPLLEQSGLIVPLGSWVLIMRWSSAEMVSSLSLIFHMSINLSYRLAIARGYCCQYSGDSEALMSQPSNVTLELTETYLIKEDAGTRDILEKMKKMGINLAMDDFESAIPPFFTEKHTGGYCKNRQGLC